MCPQLIDRPLHGRATDLRHVVMMLPMPLQSSCVPVSAAANAAHAMRSLCYFRSVLGRSYPSSWGLLPKVYQA